ncbi:MAG TPA: helix-turn-helix domain-containing protein [Sphingobacteriaceae bacterium]|nr:helix-turn-helix domain-containing protein [Sphingobacteriaceae bacterium]
MSEPDKNEVFELASSFVNHTSQHVFLTGKAGTGKTTFLKYIKSSVQKKAVIAAPTGVAAINAGGVTLHSLFQLPFGPYIPTQRSIFNDLNQNISNRHALLQSIRFNKEKIALLNELELLVIDEISMVRADMLDAIDVILRHFRKNPAIPFGGVQVLYIGDLFQLPPVVKREEWQILKEFYASPFFFDALVTKEAPPLQIELKNIYRQNEPEFIQILNNIRNNQLTRDDLELLEKCYNPNFHAANESNYITLTSHNHQADTINEQKLNELNGEMHLFKAETTGNFDEKLFPLDKVLRLKTGAQIMFIKNDKGENRRFFNGKIGTVSRINQEGIFVSFPGEDDFRLEKESWKNIRYKNNEEEGRIEEEILGEFKQFPIRFAWAVTIHKSQGLTFERAVIDAGKSFAAGQVYVALSRVTTLKGLVLLSRINSNNVTCSKEVLEFITNQEDEAALGILLKEEQKKFIFQTVKKAFNWQKLIEIIQEHNLGYEKRRIENKPEAIEMGHTLFDAAIKLEEVAAKFRPRLDLLLNSEKQDYNQLFERINAACTYFTKEMDEALILPLKQHIREVRGKKQVKKYLKALRILEHEFEQKTNLLKQAFSLAEGLMKGNDNATLLKVLEQDKKLTRSADDDAGTIKEKQERGSSQRYSLQLFKEGKKISEIAADRCYAQTTIEGHLAQFVKTGELSVFDLIAKDKVDVILKEIGVAKNPGMNGIKEKLGSNYSFFDIRAVINHHAWLTSEQVNTKETRGT